MVLCFILFGIVSVITAWLFSEKQLVSGLITSFIALFVLGLGFIFYDSKIAEAKIKALDVAGIEYLSNDEVYNKSQAELDKMIKVSTLSGTYYYDLGDKE